MTSAALCASSVIVKWRRQCLLLTLQLGSQMLCKLLDADHDNTRKYFFDYGQKTEISISEAGYFGEMKKTETPSTRWRVGRYAIAIADRQNARNDFSRRECLSSTSWLPSFARAPPTGGLIFFINFLGSS